MGEASELSLPHITSAMRRKRMGKGVRNKREIDVAYSTEFLSLFPSLAFFLFMGMYTNVYEWSR